MDNFKQQTQNALAQAQNIQILVSPKSGLDGTAAGLALYLSLKKLGKNVHILAKEPTIGDARMLYAVDKIGQNQSKKNLVINVNNAIQDVDRVTYSLEGSVLKIIVHALSDSQGITTENINFSSTEQEADVVYVIGYTSVEEMRTDVTLEQSKSSKSLIISVNVMESDKKIAQINIHEPRASSISEVMSGYFQSAALPLDSDIAFNLYSGLASATQMFSPKLVNESTFQTASWLLKFGAANAGLASLSDQTKEPIVAKTKIVEEPDIRYDQPEPQLNTSEMQGTPIENVEVEKQADKDWLKPPKIYRGSKSFDIES